MYDVKEFSVFPTSFSFKVNKILKKINNTLCYAEIFSSPEGIPMMNYLECVTKHRHLRLEFEVHQSKIVCAFRM